jgi:uncharacterized protein (DUF433 family)
MDTARRTAKARRQPSIFDAPSYRAGEVAHLLKLPHSTVLSWCFGQAYRNRQGAPKTFQPVIEPAAPVGRLLSFSNLCELHVLAAITRHHRVPLQRVRAALARARREMQSPRPLLAEDFRTNGLHLFLEHAGQLVNVSGGGQAAFGGEFERALDRIERGAGGAPVRLFPFSRRPDRTSEQPQVIAIDPRIAFGRPIVAKARVRTDVIFDRFGAGDSPAEMAGDYGVGEEGVLEALRYEQSLAA